jgi:TIR domain
VNGNDTEAEVFDVFLSYHSEDEQAVREIAKQLYKEGVKPWLDKDQIRPGTSWQTVLGQQINCIKSAAIFVGDGGLGPWQDHEMQSFLNRFVTRKCAVVPVILPSARGTPELPWPLENLHRVDFRTDSQPLERLIWGITGQKPAELVDVTCSEQPATMREGAGFRLISSSDKQAASDNVISETRLFPPLGESPDPENVIQLNILRKRVMEYWVDGVLRHSLYQRSADLSR